MTRLFQLFLWITLLPVSGYLQTVSIELDIKEKETGQPIENAFVFLENTSVGEYTDEKGHVVLQDLSESSYIVVVNHLLYEDYSFDLVVDSDEKLSIELAPKSYDITEVTIKARGKKSKKYKSWMKRFEEAFIGDRKIRRKVKIQNPEVIWFEETDSMLYAHAVDNIKVRNELTGYDMQITLDKFSLSLTEDVVYSGKIYYEDIINDLKKTDKVHKRRKEFYRHSRQLFFKSLITSHPVNSEEYEFGITRPGSDGRMTYTQLGADQLVWSYGPTADTLMVEDYLTVRVKDVLVRSFVAKGVADHVFRNAYASTFLLSKTGRFIISHEGYLLNEKEIEESDYWASNRIAYEQPRDYTGDVIFTERGSYRVLDDLLAYKSAYKPEKIFLHTDKSVYLPFENMWFKGYLVDGVDHTNRVESQVVYVNLLNDQGVVVKDWLLHTDIGLKGDMQWTSHFEPGNYKLRAYTNHMRNQGGEFLFEKNITLSSLTDAATINQGDSSVLRVSFYPEGGELISGISTQVAFKATTVSDMPVAIEGEVISSTGDLISDVSTMHQGVGVFALTPEMGEKYTLKIKQSGEDLFFDLPETLSSGLSLNVNATQEESLFVEVESSDDASMEGSFLIGHARGEVFVFLDNLSIGKSLEFKKSTIPQGLIHFTVFDKYERPHAERMAYNDWNFDTPSISSTYVNTSKEERVLELTLDSALLEKNMDLSVSVVKEVFADTDTHSQDIKSYFLLNSDLKKRIPNLNYYLGDITQTKRYYLDLILRCVGWTRFTWRDIENSEPSLDYPAERGYAIEGFTSEKDSDEGVQSSVMITALGYELLHQTDLTTTDGSFSFDDLTYMDSVTYVIQGRKNNRDQTNEEEIKLEGDRLLDIHVAAKTSVAFESRPTYLISANMNTTFDRAELEDLRTTFYLLQEADSTLWSIEAPEVEIRSRRQRFTTSLPLPGIRLDLDHAPWIPQNASGLGLLMNIAPKYQFYFGAEGQLMSKYLNKYGEWVVRPSQVIIDGMGGEPGGSTTARRLMGLTADDIQYAYVNKSVVVIVRRNIPRSVEKRLGSGIMHYVHPGYFAAREFSDVTAHLAPELSSTLYWDPDVKIDASGKLDLTIPSYAMDVDFVLTIQGVSQDGELISYRIEN